MEDYMEGDILSTATTTAAEHLIDALNRHDVDGIMNAMTADCVLDAAQPAPDGTRVAGQEAVRRYWEAILQRSREVSIEVEEVFAAGDSCAIRHLYRWVEEDGTPGHVRGATLFRVRSGRVAEMHAYVKG
jgi:ketosteroid isomerase-like protein